MIFYRKICLIDKLKNCVSIVTGDSIGRRKSITQTFDKEFTILTPQDSEKISCFMISKDFDFITDKAITVRR